MSFRPSRLLSLLLVRQSCLHKSVQRFAPFCAFAALVWTSPTFGEGTKNLDGRVVSVTATSGLVVVDDSQIEHIIQLAAVIPVPPKHPLYTLAKKRLEILVLEKKVTIQWDRQEGNCAEKGIGHCEKSGKVLVDGRDVNLELISYGLAQYDRSAKDSQSTTDRTLYNETEEDAKREGLGIWKSNKRKPATHRRRKQPKPGS